MQRPNGTTRQEILFAIKYSGWLTADTLARQLSVSSVAIRQHLAPLLAEGSVTIDVQRQGRGRPSHYYRLTARADEQFPRRYADLAADLIAELREWQGEEAVQALFARRRETEAAMLHTKLLGKESAARVNELARLQSESGHMTRVAAGGQEGEYLLIQHNCPIYSFARQHPQLCCHNDLAMLRNVLCDMNVECEQHIANGDPVCRYRIRSLPSGATADGDFGRETPA